MFTFDVGYAETGHRSPSRSRGMGCAVWDVFGTQKWSSPHGFSWIPIGQSLSNFFQHSKRWHQDGIQIAFAAQNLSFASTSLTPVKTKMEHTKSQPPKINQKHMFKRNNRHNIIFLAHFQAHFPGSIYFQKIIFQIPICLNSHLPSQVVQVFF